MGKSERFDKNMVGSEMFDDNGVEILIPHEEKEFLDSCQQYIGPLIDLVRSKDEYRYNFMGYREVWNINGRSWEVTVRRVPQKRRQ